MNYLEELEKLPVKPTKSDMILEQRKNYKRWGSKYTKEETDLYSKIILEVYLEDDSTKLIQRKTLVLTKSLHDILDKLSEVAGRPHDGLVKKLLELRILTIEKTTYNSPPMFYINKKHMDLLTQNREYNGGPLKDDEYLIKIRDWDNTAFMTKLNKDGSIPLKFTSWESNQTIKIFINKPMTWKFIGVRIGKSQSWAIIQNEKGFKLEIYLSNMMDLIYTNIVDKGSLEGTWLFKDKKLIKA